jgi:hypothetical protein
MFTTKKKYSFWFWYFESVQKTCGGFVYPHCTKNIEPNASTQHSSSLSDTFATQQRVPSSTDHGHHHRLRLSTRIKCTSSMTYLHLWFDRLLRASPLTTRRNDTENSYQQYGAAKRLCATQRTSSSALTGSSDTDNEPTQRKSEKVSIGA